MPPYFAPGGGSAYTFLDLGWENIEAVSSPARIRDTAYSPTLDLFVALSENGGGSWLNNAIATSPTADDLSWTPRSLPSTLSWESVAWSPDLGLFAAVNDSSGNTQVYTSPDGINWTARTTPAQTVTLRNIIWADGKFVCVGQTASNASLNLGFYSTDGITWNNITAGNDSQWRGLAYSPTAERFVACAVTGAGNQQRIMVSSNGIGWTLRSVPTNARAWGSVEWSPGLGKFLCMGGASGFVMTSTDGLTWDEHAMVVTGLAGGATNAWESVAWAPSIEKFIAVASSGNLQRIATSSDGINWVGDTAPNNQQAWRRVRWYDSHGFALASGDEWSGTGVSIARSCTRVRID